MIKVKSIITAEIGRKGYRQFPANQIESFAIDSAMDTDADSFSIDLGAPTPDLKFLVDRDNEVRVSLFTDASPRGDVEHLHTGIADVVSYSSEDFVLSIAGRDLSSVATDSQAPPGEWKSVRPDAFVRAEARALGISRMQLAKVTGIGKFYRDGSESYWESWYRMYRKRKMWIWQEPGGTLIADNLHYSASPTYYFGTPAKGSPRSNWIPLEQVTITKDTTKRVGEVWVFGDRGDLGFVSKASDPSTQSWIKRPIKIVTSTQAKNRVDATKEAWEEIFEGKVGSLEISIMIPHIAVGKIVKQNTMAEVNVPDMGLHGIFFVVGSNLRGGPGGYFQEIRLREKNYAISRRVPDDPKLVADPADSAIPGDIGATLKTAGVRWPGAFAAAAQEFHGGWPYDLFLGVLLAICDKETGFRNLREGGDVEWYPKPLTHSAGGPPSQTSPIDRWRQTFANDPGNPLNPFDRDAGVGPFQLTTHTYKEWADGFGGKNDEYEGGRWVPQANIRAGAKAFAAKLAGLDPKKPEQIWEGVRAYNGSGIAAFRYRDSVRAIYNTRYATVTKDIEKTAASLSVGTKTNITVKDEYGNPFDVKLPDNAPAKVKTFINFLLRQLGKPYEWGAEGPRSFDCSGLIIAGTNAAGINGLALMGRTTYTMVKSKNLTPVKKNELLPGDLVFFASGTDVHHVGIYLNDGHMIHAPHTGDVVKISSMNSDYWRTQYYGARRIFTDWFLPFTTDFGS